MTAREAILGRLGVLLTTIQGATFFRSREAAVARSEGTVISLRPEDEQVEKRASLGDITLRNLIVIVSVISRGNVPDQAADPVIQAAHSAIMADATLGGLCAQIIEQSTKWNFALADTNAAEAEIRYTIRYLTRASDISQPT